MLCVRMDVKPATQTIVHTYTRRYMLCGLYSLIKMRYLFLGSYLVWLLYLFIDYEHSRAGMLLSFLFALALCYMCMYFHSSILFGKMFA